MFSSCCAVIPGHFRASRLHRPKEFPAAIARSTGRTPPAAGAWERRRPCHPAGGRERAEPPPRAAPPRAPPRRSMRPDPGAWRGRAPSRAGATGTVHRGTIHAVDARMPAREREGLRFRLAGPGVRGTGQLPRPAPPAQPLPRSPSRAAPPAQPLPRSDISL